MSADQDEQPQETQDPSYEEQLELYEKQVAIYKEQLALHEKSVGVARENRRNSEVEYDKLIVSLASGGLALTIGFVKDIVVLSKATHLLALLVTWISLALALLTNLLSHRLTVITSDKFLTDDKRWKRYNTLTEWANWSAMGLLVAGVCSFVIFVSLNLRHMKDGEKPKPSPSSGTYEKLGQTLPASTVSRPAAPTPPDSTPKK